MDWWLFGSAVAFAISVHVETILKRAAALMDIDAQLAPDWAFSGLGKIALKLVSMLGGIAAAVLCAYDWLHTVGWVGAAFIGPAKHDASRVHGRKS
jgi:hypothetical protein